MIQLKVNYQKHFDNNGYVYKEVITISKDLAWLFNKDLYLYKCLNKTSYEASLIDYIMEDYNYLKLTTLKRFKAYIDYNFPDLTKRIKTDRNAIIIVD